MQRPPTSPEARLPWPAGARGDDARDLRESAPTALTGAPWLWATFCQRPRAVAGRSCPRSAKAMLRLDRRVRPTGKRRRRRLRLRRFARCGSAGLLRNQHVCVPSASHTDMSVPFDSDRAAGRLRTQARAASSPLAAPHPAHPTARMPFAEGDGSHRRAEPRPGRAQEGVTAPCHQPRQGPAGPSPRQTAMPSVSLRAPGFAVHAGRFQQRARAWPARTGATRALRCLCRGQ